MRAIILFKWTRAWLAPFLNTIYRFYYLSSSSPLFSSSCQSCFSHLSSERSFELIPWFTGIQPLRMFHVKHSWKRSPKRRTPLYEINQRGSSYHPLYAHRSCAVVLYISLISCLSVSSSSRSSRLSFIFSSTFVTEYMTVEWSRMNFFPMSLNGKSSICRER